MGQSDDLDYSGVDTNKKYNSRSYRSDFVCVVCCLAFSDARHAFDHSDDTFTYDDEGEELQSLDEMRVFEADYPPDDSDEEDS